MTKKFCFWESEGDAIYFQWIIFDNLPNVNGEIKVKRIQTNHAFDGFGRCLAIRDGLFVVENGDEKLNLLK
nr:hypothetical protein [Clostridium sporogenes]